MSHSMMVQSGSWRIGQWLGAFGFSFGSEVGPVMVWRDPLGSIAASMSWFPDFQFRKVSSGEIRLIIPHWTVVAVYALLWVSLGLALAWHRRRAKDALPKQEPG